MERQQNKKISWIIRDKYNGQAPQKSLAFDIERLNKGEPLDYIIGWKPFLGCHIDLTLKPLIPRAETEYWTEKAISEIKKTNKPKVLDIFSGSGCIGISVLKHVKNSTVDFAEVDKKLAKQIKKNLTINKLNKKRTRVITSNIFSNIKSKYDFILANPPYIPLARKSKLHKSVVKEEPRTALFGGKDGLKIITSFLKGARRRLKNDGKIFMEFDYGQKKSLETIIKKSGFGNCEFHKDQYGRWRFVVIS